MRGLITFLDCCNIVEPFFFTQDELLLIFNDTRNSNSYLTLNLHDVLQVSIFFYSLHPHRILIGLVLLLCLVGTSLDIAIGFMKPHSTPVNKSDGFMPVRGASMATDHDTFSDSSNLIHSSTVSSSSRPILSSLPQEPAKPSRYYVNQCAVVVELLLRLFNCGCSVSIHPLRVLNATDIFLRIV